MIILIAFLITIFISLGLIFIYRDKVRKYIKRNWKKIIGIAILMGLISTPLIIQPPSPPEEDVDYEAYFYEHFVPPAGSFGMDETTFKTVNWSYFWSIFRDHSDWQLEAWHPVNEEWVDNWQGENLNNWLNISRIRSDDNGSEKITLNVTNMHPTQPLHFRFSFGIDLRVKQYINKTSNYEYVLTYPANDTEDYVVYFNFSDVKPLIQNGVVLAKQGIKNIGGDDIYWFRITQNMSRNALQAGHSFEIDPTFGYSDEGSQTTCTGGGNANLLGHYANTGSAGGTAQNITVKLSTWATSMDTSCSIYEYIDYDDEYAGDLIATTETVAVTGSDDNKEFTYAFNEPKPELTAYTNYYLVFRPHTGSYSSNFIKADTSDPDHGIWQGDEDSWPESLDSEISYAYDFYIYCTFEANPVSLEGEQPTDESIYDSITPKCNITCVHSYGSDLTVYFYENTTGNWVLQQTNSSHTANTSAQWTYTNASSYNHTYYWSVNATDGTNWRNESYSFTTNSKIPEFSNEDPTNASSGVSINKQLSVQVNDSEGNSMDLVWWQNCTSRPHSNWINFGRNESRYSHVSECSHTSPISNKLLWKTYCTGNYDEYGTAIAYNGMVYYASKNLTGHDGTSNLTALWLNNGTIKWSVDIGTCDDGGYYDTETDLIYVQSGTEGTGQTSDNQDKLWAFYASNGTEKWNITTIGEILSCSGTPTVDYENGIVITTAYGNAWGVWKNNGTIKWNISIGKTASSPLYYNHSVLGNIAFLPTRDSGLYCVYSLNGTEIWHNDTSLYDQWDVSPFVATVDGEEVCYIAKSDYLVTTYEKLSAVNITTGEAYWTWTGWTGGERGFYGGPSFHNNRLFVGGTSQNLYCLNASIDTMDDETREIWAYDASGDIYSLPAISHGYVYITSKENHKVHCVNEIDGTGVWTYELGGSTCFSQVCISDNIIIVSGDDYYLYALGDLDQWNQTQPGAWAQFGKNSSVNNGTYYQTNYNASEYDTKYWWRVDVSDGDGESNRTIYHYTTESESGENNPPTLDSFSLDDEGNAGWDLGHNNIQCDWTTTDLDSDPVTLYFTFNKGSDARQPSDDDNDAYVKNAGDKSNYELTWVNGTWSDYDGTVYVRCRAYDGEDYGTVERNDTFANGIDGTAPVFTSGSPDSDTTDDDSDGYNPYPATAAIAYYDDTTQELSYDFDAPTETLSGMAYYYIRIGSEGYGSGDSDGSNVLCENTGHTETTNTIYYKLEDNAGNTAEGDTGDDVVYGDNDPSNMDMDINGNVSGTSVGDPSWISDATDITSGTLYINTGATDQTWGITMDASGDWGSGGAWKVVFEAGWGGDEKSDDSSPYTSNDYHSDEGAEPDITVKIVNKCGEVQTRTLTTTEDTGAPTTSFSSITENNPHTYIYNSGQTVYFSDLMGATDQLFTVVVTASDGGAGIYSVRMSEWDDDADYNDTASPYSRQYSTDSTETAGSITLYAYDKVGNFDASPVTITMTEDTAGPTQGTAWCHADAYDDNETTDDDRTIYFTWGGISDASSGLYTVYAELNDNTPDEDAGTDGQDTDEDANEGENTYYVRGIDNVGNYGTVASDTITVTLPNQPPAFEGENPANTSSGQSLSFTWNITIEDLDGDTFDWTIECSNGDTNSANDASNGSKTLSISELSYSTEYTVWVNATDNDEDWTREWFTFTTETGDVPDVPSGFSSTKSNRSKISLSWSKGNKADYTYIEWNPTGTWSRGDGTEIYNDTGTSYSHSSLDFNTQYFYQAWSWNDTDSLWSVSYASDDATTDANLNVTYSSPSPNNGSTGQSLSLTWGIDINDPEGDWFNWSIECSNSQSDSANEASNGTKELSISGLSYSTEYKVWVNTSDKYDDWTREWFIFTTGAESGSSKPNYNTTIQRDGIDYFVWLGHNTTASVVGGNITGFDEASEYIAIWNNGTWSDDNANWNLYYGDADGTNWNIHTFDIVKVYLTDSGTTQVYMGNNSNIDYTNNRNQTLMDNSTAGKGYNYNCSAKSSFSSDLSTINSTVGLTYGSGWAEAVGVWNDSDEGNPKWDWWFAGFAYNANNTAVSAWDVLVFKIDDTEKYLDTSDF